MGKWCVVVLYPTEHHDFDDKDKAFAFVVRMASAFEVIDENHPNYDAIADRHASSQDCRENYRGDDNMAKINFEKVAAKVRKDGEECTEEIVERLYDSLTDEDRKSEKAQMEKHLFDVLINSQPPLNYD